MTSKKLMLFLLLAIAMPTSTKADFSSNALQGICMTSYVVSIACVLNAIRCIGEGLILPHDQEHTKRRDELTQQFRSSITVGVTSAGIGFSSLGLFFLIPALKEKFAPNPVTLTTLARITTPASRSY